MPNQETVSIKTLLRDSLLEDRNLLINRDALIDRLASQTTGSMMGELAALKTALQKNIGERFLAADENGSEEERNTVCDEAQRQLVHGGMQEKRARGVVEALSYALGWDDAEYEIGDGAIYIPLEESTPEYATQEDGKEPETWTCICGSVNDGKFCVDCGRVRPQPLQNDMPPVQNAPAPETATPANSESSAWTGETQPQSEAPSSPVPQSTNISGAIKGNTKIVAIAAGVLILGGMAYSMTGTRKQEPVPPQTAQSSAPAATQQAPVEQAKPRLPVTAESTLGGLKIGDTDGKIHQLLGQETRRVRGEANSFDSYRYGREVTILAGCKDTAKRYDYIFKIVAQNGASLQTDRGIRIGSTVQEMLQVYDDNFKKIEDYANKRATYVYEFAPPIGNNPGKLEFTVDTANQKISAIELYIPRKNIPVPKDFKGEGDILPELAVNVLKSYHQAITKRDFQTAYNFFSPEQQNEHGTLETYMRGYADTISSEITEASAKSLRGDTVWEVHYKLKARDQEGKRVKVQFFEGTAVIRVNGKSGKIIDMSSRKTGERYE